jgi:hypothetical protein
MTDSIPDLPPEPLPAGLADRITAAAVADFRFRRTVRFSVRGAACVAAVVIVGWLAWPSAAPTVVRRPVVDPFRETTQVLTQAAHFELPTVTLPEGIALDLPEPPGEKLRSLQDTARRGLDPLAAPVTRAANRWARDFGSAFALPKPRM